MLDSCAKLATHRKAIKKRKESIQRPQHHLRPTPKKHLPAFTPSHWVNNKKVKYLPYHNNQKNHNKSSKSSNSAPSTSSTTNPPSTKDIGRMGSRMVMEEYSIETSLSIRDWWWRVSRIRLLILIIMRMRFMCLKMGLIIQVIISFNIKQGSSNRLNSQGEEC